MALTEIQKTSKLFKQTMGKSETDITRQFFEEPFNSGFIVFGSEIWSESNLIPTTAPSESVGVVQKIENLILNPVNGTSNSFYHELLKDCIPFNYGDGSYNYIIKNSNDESIPFGANDWILDPKAGVLTFYSGVPSGMPPKISFYKYVGQKGINGSTPENNIQQNNITNGDNLLYSLSILEHQCFEWTLKLKYNSKIYATKILAILNDNEIDFSEYGSIGNIFNVEILVVKNNNNIELHILSGEPNSISCSSICTKI